MQTLETLIRLAEQELDVLRQNMGMYQDKYDEIDHERLALIEQLAQERALAEQQPETMQAYTRYAAHNQFLQARHNATLKTLQQQMDTLQEKIREQFMEMKRYEILQRQRDQKAVKKTAQREAQMLDELALQAYTRKDSSNS